MENITNLKCQIINNQIELYMTAEEYNKMILNNLPSKINFHIISTKTNNKNNILSLEKLNTKINRLTKAINKIKKKSKFNL